MDKVFKLHAIFCSLRFDFSSVTEIMIQFCTAKIDFKSFRTSFAYYIVENIAIVENLPPSDGMHASLGLILGSDLGRKSKKFAYDFVLFCIVHGQKPLKPDSCSRGVTKVIIKMVKLIRFHTEFAKLKLLFFWFFFSSSFYSVAM